MRNRKNAEEASQVIAVALVAGFIIFVIQTVLDFLF